jgi:hypothetical protein
MRPRDYFIQLALLAGVGVALIGADRAWGWTHPHLKLARILFPPATSVTVATPEFRYTASINSQGFRGRELGARTSGRLRVVAIGDSFTFGWGVADEQTWVRVLERGLQGTGRDVEIANLGKPGSGPAEYALVAKTAIPLLKPDVVLIALQETDDLQQALPDAVYAGMLKGLARTDLPGRIEDRIRRTFPNFLLVLSPRQAPPPEWGVTVRRIQALDDPGDRQRFDRLAPDVRRRYLDGELNPGLLVIALKEPGYYAELADGLTPRLEARARALVDELGSIRAAAAQQNATVIVVSVPNRAYVSAPDVANVARLGFETRAGMWDWDRPDDVTRNAAKAAGIDAVVVTAAFRQQCRAAPCYFEFDDHLLANGHRALGELLVGPIAALLPKS